MPTGSTLSHQVLRHSWCIFPDHCPWRCTCWGTIVKGDTKWNHLQCWTTSIKQVWTDRTRCYPIIHLKDKVVKKNFFRLFDLVVANAHILHNKTRKKCCWKFSMKKSRKDCSLVPVLKCKCKVRLPVQLADFLGETIFYIGFQRHMLRWRELHSAHVACMQREANARPQKL
jgi:hypothetical protein